MAEILPITRFGNPVLRETARRLTGDEILSSDTQSLIENMRHTLIEKSMVLALLHRKLAKVLP